MTIDPTTARLHLLQWLSPAFPVSAFAYSQGLETVIADGRITDAAALSDWIAALLRGGSGRADAVLVALACRGACPLDALADIAAALAPSRERWLETRDMGRAFAETTARMGLPPLDGDLPYPVAFGARAATLGLPVPEVLAAYLHAFAAAQISVAVRLVPLGQSDGQRALAGLSPLIADLANSLALAGVEAIDTATPAADMAALQHETLDVRLFRT